MSDMAYYEFASPDPGTGMSASSRRVRAVAYKQLKDTLKNRVVLIQFVLFPLMALVLTQTVGAGAQDMPHSFFAVLFGTMYAGMAPAIVIAAVITEEKDNHTLLSVRMANVKPTEYLVGNSIIIVAFCALGALALGLVGGFSGSDLEKFVAVVMAGVVISLILGSVIGMVAKNQMAATGLTVPLSLMLSFLPIMSQFNPSVGDYAQYFYTQQVYLLVHSITDPIPARAIWIITANLVLLGALFQFTFRTRSLKG